MTIEKEASIDVIKMSKVELANIIMMLYDTDKPEAGDRELVKKALEQLIK